MEEHSDKLNVDGCVLSLCTEGLPHGLTTGYRTWDGALVLIQYLRERPELVRGKRVVDLSSGNGLCALACAALGAADVLATEIPACVPLLDRNFKLNADRLPVAPRSIEFWWGSELPAELAEADVVMASDILYESVRDGLQPVLTQTLVDLSCQRTVYFCFEDRIGPPEKKFMDELAERCAVQQISSDQLNFDCCKSQFDWEEGSMFWEAPDVKLYTIDRL